MRKLTENDFRTFIKRTVSDLNPPDGFMGSEKMIGKVMDEENLSGALAGFMMRALVAGGPPTAALSLWATGFQMGREFEISAAEIAELNRIIPPERTRKRKPAGLANPSRPTETGTSPKGE